MADDVVIPYPPRTQSDTLTQNQTWSGLETLYTNTYTSSSANRYAYDMLEYVFYTTATAAANRTAAALAYDELEEGDWANLRIVGLSNSSGPPTNLRSSTDTSDHDTILIAADQGSWEDNSYNSTYPLLQTYKWTFEHIQSVSDTATGAYSLAYTIHTDRIANGNANYSQIDESLAINDAYVELNRLQDWLNAFYDDTLLYYGGYTYVMADAFDTETSTISGKTSALSVLIVLVCSTNHSPQYEIIVP